MEEEIATRLAPDDHHFFRKRSLIISVQCFALELLAIGLNTTASRAQKLSPNSPIKDACLHHLCPSHRARRCGAPFSENLPHRSCSAFVFVLNSHHELLPSKTWPVIGCCIWRPHVFVARRFPSILPQSRFVMSENALIASWAQPLLSEKSDCARTARRW